MSATADLAAASRRRAARGRITAYAALTVGVLILHSRSG